jgi:hypothetical protein
LLQVHDVKVSLSQVLLQQVVPLYRQLYLLLRKLDQQPLVALYLRPQRRQLLCFGRPAAAALAGAAARGGGHLQRRLHILLDLSSQVCREARSGRRSGSGERS